MGICQQWWTYQDTYGEKGCSVNCKINSLERLKDAPTMSKNEQVHGPWWTLDSFIK